MQKFYRVDEILCARHGREIASHFLSLTLVQGWWGVTSFFFNIAAVINDAMMLARAGRLAETEPRISIPPAPVS